MSRVFQVFHERGGRHRAVATGPAWIALTLPWAWAMAHRLWARGLILLAVDAILAWLAAPLLPRHAAAITLFFLVPRVVTMLRGHGWVALRWENEGLEYLGEIEAARRSDAIAQVARSGGEIPRRRPGKAPGLWALPPHWQPTVAVARLTVRAAFRYRLVMVLLAVLLGAVVFLPMVVKHDETARGFTQILLTYTLGVITAILSLVTLWLACGTLARDVDEAQMQMVATKPIPRWQVWLGKWLGIMALDVMLLGLSGATVFLLMQWRATQLPEPLQEEVRNSVLTARASIREPVPDFRAEIEKIIRERREELLSQGVDLREFRTHALEAFTSGRNQVVPPEHMRRFRLDARSIAREISGKPIAVRVKFFAAELTARRPYQIEIAVGPEESPERQHAYRSLAPEAFHEIPFEAAVLDAEGTLIVDVMNRSDAAIIVPYDEGLEVLYPEGGFGLNYVRALLVVACWLGLLAAIGLWAASFLSFPVAAFLATTVLIVGMSTGTIRTVVEDQTVLGINHDNNTRNYPLVDAVMLPVFKVLFNTIELVRQFSPIDAVSTGRSITWGELGRAVVLVVVLMGGVFAAIGITAFTRRELATAQSNH